MLIATARLMPLLIEEVFLLVDFPSRAVSARTIGPEQRVWSSHELRRWS
jgi:hypothetical protein